MHRGISELTGRIFPAHHAAFCEQKRQYEIKANGVASGFSCTEAVAEIVLTGNPVLQVLAHTGFRAAASYRTIYVLF